MEAELESKQLELDAAGSGNSQLEQRVQELEKEGRQAEDRVTQLEKELDEERARAKEEVE